jgi:hypothetical protein
VKLLQNRALQKAGYPLMANDLTLEEWFDLGRVKESLDRMDGGNVGNGGNSRKR